MKIEYGSNFEFYKTGKIKESIKFHKKSIYYGSGRYAICELIQHYVNLGDWISYYTYGEFTKGKLILKKY